MNSQEFYLWLNGYLEALESEEITECKIKNIRKKMTQVKDNKQNMSERVIYGPDIQNKTIQRPIPSPNYPTSPPSEVKIPSNESSPLSRKGL